METLSIGNQRLLQLAEHLEKGKLGHAKFNFGQFNEYARPGQCGTAGCAIGECPVLWPNEWTFSTSYNAFPELRGVCAIELDGAYDLTDASIYAWFHLNPNEACHLFYPGLQDTESYGGYSLSRYATKEQVAANIRAFVALRSQPQS